MGRKKNKVFSLENPELIRGKVTYPYTPFIGGPTIVDKIDLPEPVRLGGYICPSCGKEHSNMHRLNNCPCYDDYYDACLG